MCRVPHLERLARAVLPRMPRTIRTSSTLKSDEASSGTQLLNNAVAAEHISLRTETHAYGVAVDCDHPRFSEIMAHMAAYGLPAPTWHAADPWKGTTHGVWWLHDAVVLTEKGRRGPQDLLDDVFALLTRAFEGDPNFTGHLTKNPWRIARPLSSGSAPAVPMVWEAHLATNPHMRWSVGGSCKPVSLRDLRKALLAWQKAEGIPNPRRKPASAGLEIDQEASRGTILFNTARRQVYRAWRAGACDVSGIQDIIQSVADQLGSPIKPRQVAAMARGMERFCRRHLDTSGAAQEVNRGRDHLDGLSLDLSEKQSVSARNTNQQRRQGTDEALLAAADRLIQQGLPVTQAALVEASGRSRATIVRRWNEVLTRCTSVIGARWAPPLPTGEGSLKKKNLSLREVARLSQIRSDFLTLCRQLTKAANKPGSDPATLELPQIPEVLVQDREVLDVQAALEQAIWRAGDHAQKRARDQELEERKAMIRAWGRESDFATMTAWVSVLEQGAEYEMEQAPGWRRAILRDALGTRISAAWRWFNGARLGVSKAFTGRTQAERQIAQDAQLDRYDLEIPW